MTPGRAGRRQSPQRLAADRDRHAARAPQVSDVNQLVNRFVEARKMMSQMAKGGGMPGMPGMAGSQAPWVVPAVVARARARRAAKSARRARVERQPGQALPSSSPTRSSRPTSGRRAGRARPPPNTLSELPDARSPTCWAARVRGGLDGRGLRLWQTELLDTRRAAAPLTARPDESLSVIDCGNPTPRCQTQVPTRTRSSLHRGCQDQAQAHRQDARTALPHRRRRRPHRA